MKTKLFELNRPSDPEVAAEILKKAGYQKLSTGQFSSVFFKNNDRWVLKLFAARDKSYIHFVQFCLQPENRGNPYLPKFKSGLVKVTDGYYAVRMERLYPCNNDHLIKLIDLCMDYALYRNISGQLDYLILRKRNPELAETIMKIGKWHQNTDAQNDIHRDNIMQREDGTVVIIEATAYMS